MQRTPARLVPCLTLLLSLILPGLARGQAAGQVRSAPLAPAPAHLAKTATVEEPPARIAAGFGVEPLARLVPAEEGAADQLAALAAWNRAGRLPIRTGIVRPVPLPQAVRFGRALVGEPAGLHAGGVFARVGSSTTIWGTSVRVERAQRIRLILDDLSLPPGTRMWVYGDGGKAVAFGPELAHEGVLWAPTVSGTVAYLEVELDRKALASGSRHGFTIARVAEIFPLGQHLTPILEPRVEPRSHDECLKDVSCIDETTFPVVNEASTAVAQIQFPISGQPGFVGLCSGGLLNLADGAPPGLPFPFLTAHHCLSTQQEAAGLEAFFDARTSSCDGAAPSLDSVPSVVGSNLLATGGQSDFTLLELSSIPGPQPGGNRFALGWNAENSTLPQNTVTHRISHPVTHQEILSQRYTRYRIKGTGESIFCGESEDGGNTDDFTKFHHSVFLDGGTFGGSSGAPLILDNGQVVGQLLGACGSKETVHDGCSTENDELDGNFFTTFDLVAPYLGVTDPPSDDWLTTAEQPGFEFQVRITPPVFGAIMGQAESDCIGETFCASGALAGRPEVFIKIIGPRPNGFLWVQTSRFTPSRVEVWVRQVSTGQINYYDLAAVPPGSDDVSGLQDREAFDPD